MQTSFKDTEIRLLPVTLANNQTDLFKKLIILCHANIHFIDILTEQFSLFPIQESLGLCVSPVCTASQRGGI